MELAAAGRPAEAIDQFDKVISLDPDYATAYFRKGDLLAEAGRLDDARAALQAGVNAAQRAGDNHLVMKMTERLGQLK
jgi:tetratricopeptide (TPR) repeat protein